MVAVLKRVTKLFKDKDSKDNKDIKDNNVDYKERIMTKFKEFIDCVFDNNKLNVISKSIGIEIIPTYKEVVIDCARNSLDKHLYRFLEERKDNEYMTLDGTLFFLTLKNSIIDLSYKLYESMSNGKN